MPNDVTHPAVPAWLTTAAQLVTTVGVPTVVAGVLLYFTLVRVDAALEAIQRQEDLRTQFVARMQTEFIAAIEEQTKASVAAIEKNIETQKQIADMHRAERAGRRE